MRPEVCSQLWQNMSAPPRSTVTLPRMAAPGQAAAGNGRGLARGSWPIAQIAIGPGGGRILTNAVCVGKVLLAHALCAWLGIAMNHELLSRRLGAARLWLALLRARAGVTPRNVLEQGTSLCTMGDGELLAELAARVSDLTLPQWVPGFAVAQAIGADLAEAISDSVPSILPGRAVADPWTAARLGAAIHGPLLLRARMPSLEHLLEIPGRSTPSLAWILWRPAPVGHLIRPVCDGKDTK
jgi:hypothetical protein